MIINYYNEIKNELINNEINIKVKKYSIKLVSEVNKKYNEISLKRMRQFYWKVEKGATV